MLIGAGWWLQPKLALDLTSLNRLIVQVVLPAFFVHYLSTSAVPAAAAWSTAWFTALQFIGLTGVGWLIAGTLGFRGAVPVVIGLATALSNSGNFGIPLAEPCLRHRHDPAPGRHRQCSVDLRLHPCADPAPRRFGWLANGSTKPEEPDLRRDHYRPCPERVRHHAAIACGKPACHARQPLHTTRALHPRRSARDVKGPRADQAGDTLDYTQTRGCSCRHGARPHSAWLRTHTRQPPRRHGGSTPSA